MQNLENDMDDLFKRAAENYPLQPGNGDWESIAKRISEKSSAEAIAPKNKRSKKFIFGSILLLTLLGGWLTVYNFKTGTKGELSTKEVAVRHNEKLQDNNSGSRDEKKYPGVSTRGNENGNSNKKVVASKLKNPGGKKAEIKIYFFDEGNIENPNVEEPQDEIDVKAENNISRQIPNSKSDEILQNNTEKIYVKDDNASADFKLNLQQSIENSLEKLNTPVNGKNKNKETVFNPGKQKGIYLGLIAGLDFSKVQSTSFENSGFDVGLIFGFKLSSGLSVESGFTHNQKKYTSEGKSFSMNKVSSTMPSGMIIKDLASKSSIIEIPVKIKYNLVNRRESGFFVSGGVSAYIITKEKNNYNVTLNGTEEKVTGTYEKDDYRLPAVANISAGYEHKISKHINIRVEPFLKIPLQGMGVGSLPVTSTGVHFGVIRQF